MYHYLSGGDGDYDDDARHQGKHDDDVIMIMVMIWESNSGRNVSEYAQMDNTWTCKWRAKRKTNCADALDHDNDNHVINSWGVQEIFEVIPCDEPLFPDCLSGATSSAAITDGNEISYSYLTSCQFAIVHRLRRSLVQHKLRDAEFDLISAHFVSTSATPKMHELTSS